MIKNLSDLTDVMIGSDQCDLTEIIKNNCGKSHAPNRVVAMQTSRQFACLIDSFCCSAIWDGQCGDIPEDSCRSCRLSRKDKKTCVPTSVPTTVVLRCQVYPSVTM